MTHPPEGSDGPGRSAGGHDPGRRPTQPVPSVERPGGDVAEPPAGQPYVPPTQPPSQPSGSSGQPPWYGDPSGRPPAPARTRVGLVAAVAVGILGLVTLGAVLALSMSTTVLDRTAVERDVAAQFEQREGVALDLGCAEEMEVAPGATYECTGTTADGEDVTLRIVVTEEESAAYTWAEP
jgi:hypothetical protein